MSNFAEEKLKTKAIEGAKKVRGVARTFLTIGILNIIGGIVGTAIGWFLGILSIVLGLWELINANWYWSTPPKRNGNPSYIGILEIINVICGPIWSLFAGISNRSTLKSPEVKAYFTLLASAADTSFLLSSQLSKFKKCPNCAQSIQIEAFFCPNCGYKFDKEEIQKIKIISESNVKKIEHKIQINRLESKIKVRSFWGWFLLILGLLFFIIVLTMIITYSFDPSSRYTSDGKPFELSTLLASTISIIILILLPSILGSLFLFKSRKKLKEELKLSKTAYINEPNLIDSKLSPKTNKKVSDSNEDRTNFSGGEKVVIKNS